MVYLNNPFTFDNNITICAWSSLLNFVPSVYRIWSLATLLLKLFLEEIYCLLFLEEICSLLRQIEMVIDVSG